MGERTFTQSSVSWSPEIWKRAADHVEELRLSVHGDGYYGDFSIRWVELSGDLVPLVRAFSDSWLALYDLMRLLGTEFNEKHPTPQEVIDVLVENGWEPSEYHGQYSPPSARTMT